LPSDISRTFCAALRNDSEPAGVFVLFTDPAGLSILLTSSDTPPLRVKVSGPVLMKGDLSPLSFMSVYILAETVASGVLPSVFHIPDDRILSVMTFECRGFFDSFRIWMMAFVRLVFFIFLSGKFFIPLKYYALMKKYVKKEENDPARLFYLKPVISPMCLTKQDPCGWFRQ